MSKREDLREKRRKEELRKRIFLIGGIALPALIIAGTLSIRNCKPHNQKKSQLAGVTAIETGPTAETSTPLATPTKK